jgi:hypothetical protein
MKASKILAGCAIGCGVVILLVVIGGFVAYRRYVAPLVGAQLKMPAALQTPSVVTGSSLMTRTVFLREARLGSVTDLVLGELDAQPGPEIGLAGTEGALFVDKQSKPRSFIQFSARTSHVDIVDVEGDHICEFMNRGAWGCDASLIAHNGKTLWTYGRTPGVDDMCAGDIDGDGTLEFAVGFNGGGGVHLLDGNGKMRWRQSDGNVWHVEMADTDGNGSLEIVHSNAAGQITVRDGYGKILSRARPAAYFSGFSLCRWPSKTDRQYALLSGKDAIWLFDFQGRTVARFDAPGSPFLGQARGLPVLIKRGAPEYLAVLVELKNWDRSIMYVYDPKGSIVYQEILPEACASIAAIALDKSGAESILVGGKGEVWEYKVIGSGGSG